MRNLIFAINMTLDGCCDHARLMGSDDIHEHYAQLMRGVDVLLFGRKTYELMVPFWPDVAENNSGQTAAMNDFARAFASVSRIVVCSRSLDRAEGAKTRIVRTDLRGEIEELKRQPGKSILTGGVSIPSQLMQLGLIDEYHFVVQPIVAGEGRRLWGDIRLPETERVRLVESKVLESGSVALRYESGSNRRMSPG